MSGRNRRRWSAAEFSRFISKPEVRRVTREYGDWAHSPEGVETKLVVISTVLGVPPEAFGDSELKRSIEAASRHCNVPVGDLRIITEAAIHIWYSMARRGLAHPQGKGRQR